MGFGSQGHILLNPFIPETPCARADAGGPDEGGGEEGDGRLAGDRHLVWIGRFSSIAWLGFGKGLIEWTVKVRSQFVREGDGRLAGDPGLGVAGSIGFWPGRG